MDEEKIEIKEIIKAIICASGDDCSIDSLTTDYRKETGENIERKVKQASFAQESSERCLSKHFYFARFSDLHC